MRSVIVRGIDAPGSGATVRTVTENESRWRAETRAPAAKESATLSLATAGDERGSRHPIPGGAWLVSEIPADAAGSETAPPGATPPGVTGTPAPVACSRRTRNCTGPADGRHAAPKSPSAREAA